MNGGPTGMIRLEERVMRGPLNIGRTAFFLMRRYGSAGADIARRRSRDCANRNDNASAAEWRLVVHMIGELQVDRRNGPFH